MLTGLRSRKHIAPFDLARPASVEECCAVLAGPGRVAALAGGLDLIDRMKAGEAFDTLVSLAGVPELGAIREEGDAIVVGARVTHAALAQHPLVARRLPDLARLWKQIASPRVRLAGTLGGNLVSALPHYDALPALMALGATATMASAAAGRREAALTEPLRRGELMVEVRIPASPSVRLLADRSLHPALAVYLGADGKSLRVTIGGAYKRPPLVVLPAGDVAALPEPMADGLASSAYRRRMIEVLTRRLLIRLRSAA